MHWTGLQGKPRRAADYVPKFEGWNLFISISAFVLGASMLIFLYNMIHSWARGPSRRSNPWRAHSIEWQVSSPPPLFNFDEIPQVVGGPYEYGVPARATRSSRERRRRARGGAAVRGGGGGAPMTHVLVVANETVAGKSLIEALEQRAQARARCGSPSSVRSPRRGPATSSTRTRGGLPRAGGSTRRSTCLRSTASRPTASSSTRIPWTWCATRSRSSCRRRTPSSSRRTRGALGLAAARRRRAHPGRRRRARRARRRRSRTRRTARRTCS